MTTVLIAVDGTESDRSVVAGSLSLFGDTAHYILVSVSRDPAMIGAASVSYASAASFSAPYLSSFAAGMDEDADRAEALAAEAAVAANIEDAETLGEIGDPATVLVEIAGSRNADVIAIGASERGWFSKLFDPSVEAAVVSRATCPVLVIHPTTA